MLYPDPPVMLLDVDGVLNAGGPYPGATKRKPRFNALWDCAMNRGLAAAGDREWVIKWAQPLIDRLLALHETGAAEIRLASTWAGQSADLERLLGLPAFPAAFDAVGEHWTRVAQLKRRAAAHVQDVERRRLIWVDDNEVPHHWELAHAAMADDRTLLIRPKETQGLTPADMDRIEQFCGYPAAEPLVHLNQIGSMLRVCGATDGTSGHPGILTCPACVTAYEEARA